MKSKNKIASLLISAAILLTGCGNTENADNTDEEQDSSYSSSAISSDSEQNSDSSEPAEEILLTIEGGVLKNVPSDLTEVTIPDVVTEIGNAFSECENLTSVILPDSVKKIENNAFKTCKNVVVTYKGKYYSYKQLEDLYDMINLGEVQPKTQLTEEELERIDLSPVKFSFCNSCVESGVSVDITNAIDSIEAFDYALYYLIGQMSDDEPDLVELDPEMVIMDVYHYYFNPETAEKLIQKYYLPSFELDSIDYTKSSYWDKGKNQFITQTLLDGWSGYPSEGTNYVCENAYKKGDYYYIDVAYINEFKGLSGELFKTPLINPLRDHGDQWDLYQEQNLFLSEISSDYFSLPRYRLKFKKCKDKEYDFYTFFLVGFEPLEERPEWLDTAEKLFPTAAEWFVPYEINVPDNYTAGVISTPFGMRMYKFYTGAVTRGSENDIQTVGTRGENDIINYTTVMAGLYNSETDEYSTGGSLNRYECNDMFSGKNYYHEITYTTFYYFDRDREDEEQVEEKWLLNNKESSKEEFYSSEVIEFFTEKITNQYEFDEPFKFESAYTCKLDFRVDCKLCLKDYFNMCRIIAG